MKRPSSPKSLPLAWPDLQLVRGTRPPGRPRRGAAPGGPAGLRSWHWQPCGASSKRRPGKDIWESGLQKCFWHPCQKRAHLNPAETTGFAHTDAPAAASTTNSSGQRRFCKLIAKGQADMTRSHRGLTGVRIQFPLAHPAIHWTSKYSPSSYPQGLHCGFNHH